MSAKNVVNNGGCGSNVALEVVQKIKKGISVQNVLYKMYCKKRDALPVHDRVCLWWISKAY